MKPAKLCPSCGQVIPPANPFLPHRPVKAIIYDFIAGHPRCTRQQVASALAREIGELYDGGGISENRVSAHLAEMNRILYRQGVEIHSTKGQGAVYTLRPIP